MKVMISGSSGLIGSAVKKNLVSDGHTVLPLSRDFSKHIDFNGVDVVIHLAGEPIAEGRWNSAKKKRIKESRVNVTKTLSRKIADSESKPSVFISASAIGYYGNRGSKKLHEESASGKGFLSDVCIEWENATQPTQDAGVRTVHLRTGIVLSRQGGALKKMLLPFMLGAGGVLGDGSQFMSWITLEDMVHAIRFLIQKENLCGPFNLVAPNPVTNRAFTKILGQVSHRPTFIPMPAFAARLAFGEMADALLLSSTRVQPKKLLEAGYLFRHNDLNEALESILNEAE